MCVLVLPAALLWIASGCGATDVTPDWTSQLQPSSPCYEVNLLDGLDETSTGEVHLLFECLNYHGHFEPLSETFDGMDASTRTGRAAGIELASTVNHLPSVDVDPFAVFGLLVDALRNPENPVERLVDLVLELVYAEPASAVRGGTVDLDDPEALRAGVLVPLTELLPELATALLDDDLEAATWAADLLVSDETERWLRTLGSVARNELSDPEMVAHLGSAIAAAQDGTNDRWAGATGDSLRDVTVALTTGSGPPLLTVGWPMTVMFEDPLVRDNLRGTLDALHQDGTLPRVPSEIRWMASVDSSGGPLEDGEPSAFYRFIRLLAETNAPLECTIDLIFTQFTVDLGNMAVAILELIADWDPDVVVDTTSFVSDLLNFPLSEWLIYEVAAGGTCPLINDQMLDDLKSLETLQEPEAYDLLVFVIALLNDLKYGEESRIPELADLATILHDEGALAPTEELLRDLGNEPLMGDAIDFLPILLDPEAHGVTAGEQPPIGIGELGDVVLWFVSDEGWDLLSPFVGPVRDSDATWTALGSLSRLLTNDESSLAQGGPLLPVLFDLDPDLVLLDSVAPLLGDEVLGTSVLSILETPEVTGALFAAEGESEVPLAFLARLAVDGTLDDLLEIADLLLNTVEEDDAGGDEL